MIYFGTKNVRIRTYNVSAPYSGSDPYLAARGRLESFASLPVGWNYGRGRAISSDVIAKALGFLELGYNVGFRRFEAFPGTDGGVLLAFYEKEHDVEVRVNPNLSLRVVHDRDAEELLYRDGLSTDDAILSLTTIATKVCSFVSLMPGTTAFSAADFLARHSNRQRMGESLFSMPTAPKLPQGQFATTYTTTIEVSQENPRYFGRLTPVSFRTGKPIAAKSTRSRVIRATKT